MFSPKNFMLSAAGLLLTIVSALAVLGFIMGLQSINGNDQYRNTITVEGSAEVFAAPDIAKFSFTVRSEASEVSIAQEQVTEKMNKAIVSLGGLGVAESDIKTTNYQSFPRYEYQTKQAVLCSREFCPPTDRERVLVGYELQNTVHVKVRDVALAGDVLQLLGSANVDSIVGPNLRIENTDALKAQARQEAIVKAKEQAQILANDLGVSLGKLVSFNETSHTPQSFLKRGFAGTEMVQLAAFDAAPAPEIAVGENQVTANVSITYRIR